MDDNQAGWLLFSAPDRDAAQLAQTIAHFEAALAVDPANGVALANLARALVAAGREQEAVERLEQETFSAHAQNWLGWHFANDKQDLPRALQYFARAAMVGRWWGVAHLNYAGALELSGDLDGAYREYDQALMSGDAHDPAMAHARRGSIEYRRGWLRHPLSSTRRALYREESAPRGRLELWRADEARLERELREAGHGFPPAEIENVWIAREIAAKREGLGVDRSRAPTAMQLAWLEYEDECVEEIPIVDGPLAALESFLRARNWEAAIAELTALRAKDAGLIESAIGLTEPYGERAARLGARAAALALLGFALDGYRIYASGASVSSTSAPSTGMSASYIPRRHSRRSGSSRISDTPPTPGARWRSWLLQCWDAPISHPIRKIFRPIQRPI